MSKCKRPPKGMWCSLNAGHSGPCPTRYKKLFSMSFTCNLKLGRFRIGSGIGTPFAHRDTMKVVRAYNGIGFRCTIKGFGTGIAVYWR